VTDGLSLDLHHICDESGCGSVVFEDALEGISGQKINEVTYTGVENALCEGEDFELLMAVTHNAADQLLKEWRGLIPLTKIGAILPATEGRWLQLKNGVRKALENVGYEHRT
jgi:thiamine-monophosphate kinase